VIFRRHGILSLWFGGHAVELATRILQTQRTVQSELTRLRKENHRLKLERDILSAYL